VKQFFVDGQSGLLLVFLSTQIFQLLDQKVGDFVHYQQRMNLLLRFQSEMFLKEKLKTLLSVMRRKIERRGDFLRKGGKEGAAGYLDVT
jgi:hypothetical protein